MMVPSMFHIRAARWMTRGTACAAFWVLVTAASAQEATPPVAARQSAANSPATTQNDTTGIPEIIVTAQRRSEKLQDVPITVTAITNESLQARGVSSTGDILAAIPSVTISTAAGYLQPRIRGIGDQAVGAGFEGGVAVYVDGVYQAAPAANLFSLANIERIEVVEGPQGTLFGRNSTGGLIQVITREPSETFDGNASLTAANYADYTGDLYLTGGLAPGVALNLTAHAETQGDGWGRNQFNGEDVYRLNHDIALRSSLLLQPTDETKIRITGDYENNSGNISASQGLVPGTGFPFPGLVRATGSEWNVNESEQPFARMWSYGVSISASQDLGFASLGSITAYRRSDYDLGFDGDLSNLDLVNIDISQRDWQFSQELQLTSRPDSPIKWVAGVFYFDASSRFDPNAATLSGFISPVAPASATATIDDQLGTRSLAGYVQATAPIFDATNLTLGIRDTDERKKITDISEGFQIVGGPPPIVAPAPNQSVTNNKPTWRVSLDHRFSPELMVYASYNRGFKSGGFNGQSPTDKPFLPETLDAYEIGAKTDLFDRSLRLDASAFYYNYRDIQVTRFIDNQQSFYNGAAAKVYGLDLDFEARLTSNFTLSGGLTAIHDRFTSFPNAVYSIQVPSGLDLTTASAEGNRLPFTADLSGVVTATYRMPTAFGEASFDTSYTYNNGYYTQPDNILRQPAYNLLSFGAGLKLQNGLNVRAWVRNTLDDKVYSVLQAGTFDSGYGLQAPRTYGITLGAKF